MKKKNSKRWLRHRSPHTLMILCTFILIALLIQPQIIAIQITPVPNNPGDLTNDTNHLKATHTLQTYHPRLTIVNITPITINNISYQQTTAKQTITTAKDLYTIELNTLINAYTNEITIQGKRVYTNTTTLIESSHELIIYHKHNLEILHNINDKNGAYKALHNYIEPLIPPDYLINPQLTNIHSFILLSDTALPYNEPILNIDSYSFHVLESNDLRPLLRNKRILKIADNNPENLRKIVHEARHLFHNEAKKRAHELNLRKSHRDVISYPDLKEYLNEEPWEPKPGQISPYQRYITPDDPVIQRLTTQYSSKEQLYNLAREWIWVSDTQLHNDIEKWLLPTDFISETPQYATNPAPGTPVSDCSEQANTLCSLFRAAGIPAEDIRVAIGTVDFDDTIGGHAWVEIKENGKWLVLDPTCGPYYDEEHQQLFNREGVEYQYWKYHPYPIQEVWAYYNDIYFTDEHAEVAEGWEQGYDIFLDEEMLAGFFTYQPQNMYMLYGLLIIASSLFLIIFIGMKIKNSKKS